MNLKSFFYEISLGRQTHLTDFYLHKTSIVNRDILFKISTNVSNFHNIMPAYFKSLNIIEETAHEKIVLELINFLGKEIEIKTKHTIFPPNIHEVHLLSGPLKGTSFLETYEMNNGRTDVKIVVSLRLNGFLKYIPFFDKFLFRKMNSLMNEFLKCAEDYSKVRC